MKPEAAVVQELNEDDLRSFTNDLRYVYFGRNAKTNDHTGVVCVGYKIDKSGTVLRLAVAFCSPEDIFAKEESRVRIIKRISSAAFEDLTKDITEISEENPLFSDMRYEEIIQLITTAFNATIPADWADYKSYLNNTKKVYPTFARIKLPWWVNNLKLAV